MSTAQRNAPKTPAKNDAPKRPVELATKNEVLKCLVVVKEPLTYFGSKDKKTGEMKWRITTNPKRLFDRVDAINGDASLDAAKREKKIAEAFASFTHAVPSVAFDAKTEAEQGFTQPATEPAKKDETAA